jgi:AcrR family transcriptional regulator
MLRVAASTFAAEGFDGAKMADIAKGASVSMTTLYAAFANKETLFEAVIADHFERYVVPVLERDTSTGSPGEEVLTLVANIAAGMEDDRSFFELYARGSSGVPAKLRVQGRDPYAPYITAFQRRVVELLSATGSPIDPEDLAAALAASLIALARQAVTGVPPRPITNVTDAVRAIFGPVLGVQ